AAVAATLGSDVPFLLYGGTALGSGRGEVVEPVVMSGAVLHWVVAAAEGGLSTPQVYVELDRLREAGLAPPPCLDASALLAAVGQDDPGALGAAMHNDLEVAALSLRPDLRGILAAGLAAGAVAGMVSGSGPTCVFLAATATEVELVAKRLETAPGCRKVLVATGPAAPTTGVEG
ncbi:MAG: 4-(cytidine 5'-diphospho)-2-C-methyl-D-erythritol kinase, partial [Micromonosporaceae bacterium]|nr:4-(cytidine 5'-diphospho)-2-C-methyl-D-erythritol kinase [Micromonosporaceae bacterium]